MLFCATSENFPTSLPLEEESVLQLDEHLGTAPLFKTKNQIKQVLYCSPLYSFTASGNMFSIRNINDCLAINVT